MSLNCRQFRDLIERTLTDFDSELITKEAVTLLLATAAQESQFGTYLKQVKGPALGFFQMEPATFDWLRDHYKNKYPSLEGREAKEMEGNICLAIIMARLRYRISLEPLPEKDTPESLWPIYKKVYNTEAGSAKQMDFINNVLRYVTS